MRNICLMLGLSLMCPAIATAQLRFLQPTADLGELRGGPAYRHRFEFVNDSAQPVEILDIRLGCGCLQPVLEKRSFQPGEKATLLMNLRTLGQPNGMRSWQAQVQYRQAGKTREAILVVGANIRNEVTIEPSILAISVETVLRREVTITDHRMPPMKIKAVIASSPAIRVSTQAMKDGVTKVILEVSAAGLTAVRQEELLNIYTEDPHYRHLQVPITLSKARRAEVAATPNMVEVAGSGSQLVRLRGAGDQLVRIERADADHSALKCTWAAGPGNDATLKIVVNASLLSTPTAMAGVRVQLAAPPGAVVTIPVAMRRE